MAPSRSTERRLRVNHTDRERALFFHGDPLSTRFVTLWAGAARSQEEVAIKAWVIKNASGIPESLATCFAWYVTKVRNR